jgi:N-acetylglucosamine-6-phosphate deacetylase
LRLGVKAALVDSRLVDGDLTIDDGVIAAVGVEPAGGEGIAVPGFVDLHINGIAGVDFLTADPSDYRRAGEALARTGVVAYQPSFVSSPADAYAEPLASAREAAEGARAAGLPLICGVHLEGPFLSPEWPGAHEPEDLQLPDPRLAERLLAGGAVTMMTLAPELPGALELVEWLVARGVVVSCGHSDADAEQAHAAFDRGARAITHIHNAHRRWRPRDPGVGGAALVRADVTVQAIVDGVHLARESAHGVFLAAGRRFCLVTDAIEAAMLDAGEYELGGRAVRVRDGAVRLPDGRLAGSVLTMDQAVRNLVAGGASMADAVYAASSAPAALLGRDDLGGLLPGRPAHIAVLDDELRVRRTLVAGAEALSASA